jgi:hypothetical protein
VLAYYQLVSSHTPFNKIPPFINNWEELGNGEIYNRLLDQVQRFDNTWTGGSELDEGYVAAISYVYQVLTDYIDRIMDHSRRPILIIYGDHQPQRPIRSSASIFSVPVHVASRDPEVLDLFAAHGFEAGLRSRQPLPHQRMDRFFPMFAQIALGRPVQAKERLSRSEAGSDHVDGGAQAGAGLGGHYER